MEEKDIKEYIMNNLTLEEKTESAGFNGEYRTISLVLEGTVISEISIEIKKDDG